MNVFKAEWRFQWKSLVIWCVSMMSFLLLFMTLYPTFTEEAEIFKAMIESLPEEMIGAMGLEVDTLFSDVGFMAYIYTYVQLMLAIVASLWGITLLGREKIENASEFLLVKPLSRRRIFWSKTALGLLLLTILHLVIAGVVLLLGLLFEMPQESLLKSMQMVLLGGIMSVTFFALGMVVATILKRISNPTAMASSIGFGMFLLLLMSRLLDLEVLGGLTPLYHADTQRLISQGVEPSNVAILLVTSVIFIGISLYLYVNQDVEV